MQGGIVEVGVAGVWLYYNATVLSAVDCPYLQADYRMNGKPELVCCSVDGEIRGYLPPSLSDIRTSSSTGELQHGELEQLYKKKQVLVEMYVAVHTQLMVVLS